MAIFVSSAILYDRLREIEDARAMRVHTTEVLETLSDALDAMVDQETGARGYLISGDKRFLEPYDQGKGAFAVAMRRLRELAAKSAGLQRRLNDLQALAE